MTTISTLYGEMDANLFAQVKQIRLLICDVDGVFSDGLIYMGNQGEELKTFHTRDGFGVKAAMKAGIEVAVITGRRSQIVEDRMRGLGIKYIYQGQEDKLSAYNELLSQLNIKPSEVAYIGDDLIDWPVMQQVGFAVCVADGHPLLARRADYVTVIPGGRGAVREVCDILLEAKNELDNHLVSST
ncbi:3-deoxy-manno-octulosonate-8-phosphatase KdsC [Thaumasiovibrio sp. DFM-14]|uniref:3-deoxy-manno-octulosonate-8-phosphatase KdsC n=1 Tax=Thaumasiovibrio sp. DFM-14 TaxID=3384792 RepID=UPI0039A1ABD0